MTFFMVALPIFITVAFLAYVVYNEKKAKRQKNLLSQKSKTIIKFEKFYWTLNNWLDIKQDGYNLAEWFIKRGYKKIAIYGAKELGERLYEELKGSDVVVSYFIDKNRDIHLSNDDVKVYSPESTLEEVDVIVVTAIYYFTDIADGLRPKVRCPVVSLETVINEI